MNLSQQSPPSRPASATPVAVLIVFLLLASVIAFLRGPRAAAGLTGVAMAAASLRLLLVARGRDARHQDVGDSHGTPGGPAAGPSARLGHGRAGAGRVR